MVKTQKIINKIINNEELEQKIHTKYLGIYIDISLSRKKQIGNNNYKLNRGIGILRKLRVFLQEKKRSVQFLHKTVRRIWHICLVFNF